MSCILRGECGHEVALADGRFGCLFRSVTGNSRDISFTTGRIISVCCHEPALGCTVANIHCRRFLASMCWTIVKFHKVALNINTSYIGDASRKVLHSILPDVATFLLLPCCAGIRGRSKGKCALQK